MVQVKLKKNAGPVKGQGIPVKQVVQIVVYVMAKAMLKKIVNLAKAVVGLSSK